jgi:hypothetical protein
VGSADLAASAATSACGTPPISSRSRPALRTIRHRPRVVGAGRPHHESSTGSGPRATNVGTLLREAIDKVNKGEYGDAVTAARRAIDAMGAGWASEKNIASVDKAQRSLDQRLSLVRHALHGLASPSAHGDPVADAIKWDRPRAMAVIAGVSALAACRQPRP